MFPDGTIINKLSNLYSLKYEKTRLQRGILILSILIQISCLSASHLIWCQHRPCLSCLGLGYEGMRLTWRLYLRQWKWTGTGYKEKMETD